MNIFKQRFKTIEERFWEKVKKGDKDRCWEWQAGKDKDGYGKFEYAHGKGRAAHRVAWLLTFGTEPGKMLVCHSCDHPSCCNPYHLFLGTSADNNKDASKKGRNNGNPNHGEKRTHRFTEKQILEIRSKYVPRVYTTIKLAEEYGTTSGAIYNIITGRTWGYLKEGIQKGRQIWHKN